MFRPCGFCTPCEQHEHVGAGRLGHHLLRAVGNLPLVGEVDPEAQHRMQEDVAAREPLLRVVAVEDAVDALPQRVAIGGEGCAAGLQLLRRSAECLSRAMSGSGCVDSQFGTPRRSPAASSRRPSVERNPGHAGGIPAERRFVASRRARRPAARRRVRISGTARRAPAPSARRTAAPPGRRCRAPAGPPVREICRVYCCAEWRAVTWPISWPSTPASSASLSRNGMMPRVM